MRDGKAEDEIILGSAFDGFLPLAERLFDQVVFPLDFHAVGDSFSWIGPSLLSYDPVASCVASLSQVVIGVCIPAGLWLRWR